MGADQDVDLALAGPLEHLADLGLGPEAVDDFDHEGKLGHARAEAAMVLFRQDRRRHEHSDLLARIDRPERAADRDLGLAVADVAADQAVHRLSLGHVALDGLDGRELVGRFLIRKGRFKFGDPVRIWGGRQSPRGPSALGLDVDQLLSQIDDGHRRRVSCASPRLTSPSSRGRLGLAAAHVFLHQVDLGDGDVELGALGELEEQGFFGVLGRLVDEVKAEVTGDSVVDVDDQITLVQVEEAVDGPALVAAARDGPAHLGTSEELVVADHQRAGVDQVKAGADPAFGQMKPARARRARCRRRPRPAARPRRHCGRRSRRFRRRRRFQARP